MISGIHRPHTGIRPFENPGAIASASRSADERRARTLRVLLGEKIRYHPRVSCTSTAELPRVAEKACATQNLIKNVLNQESTMFSVATVTALLFVVFLMILGVTIWIDSKKTYILPPKLNYQDGGQETSEENATAEYKANTKNGDLIAKAAGSDSGKASVWAALGYEYENKESDERKIVVELTFKYRIQLDTDNDQSPVRARIETFLNASRMTIAERSLTAPAAADTIQNAQHKDAFVNGKQRHIVSLKAGENFRAYLKISLEAEAGAGGHCRGEIIANLSEIYYRPELNPM
jgi:cytoskeletal protein RodZ